MPLYLLNLTLHQWGLFSIDILAQPVCQKQFVESCCTRHTAFDSVSLNLITYSCFRANRMICRISRCDKALLGPARPDTNARARASYTSVLTWHKFNNRGRRTDEGRKHNFKLLARKKGEKKSLSSEKVTLWYAGGYGTDASVVGSQGLITWSWKNICPVDVGLHISTAVPPV